MCRRCPNVCVSGPVCRQPYLGGVTATAPKTTIVCKRVADLTACEYAQCRRLTFPEDEGTMLDCLRYARQYERGRTLFPRGWLPAQTLLLYDGTRLLGWCLLDHHRSSMVYVRRCARRRVWARI